MNILTCDNCGNVHKELIDVLYPLNREKTKWNIYCNISLFGCGRVVYGKSEEHVIERWNNNETDEFIE